MAQGKVIEMEFKERVISVVKRIPKGNVMSYSRVAMLAGKPGAARAVGTIMSQNPCPGSGPGKVPCHRVVKSDGHVGGYTSPEGPLKKVSLLEGEGVEIISGKISKDRYV